MQTTKIYNELKNKQPFWVLWKRLKEDYIEWRSQPMVKE